MGAISAAVLLSTFGGTAAALFGNPKPAPAMLGMELVVAMAAVIGVLFYTGRWRNAPGMALACVGGAMLMGSVFAYFAVNGVIGAHSLKPYLAARVAGALCIVGAGCVCVLIRDKRSWPAFIRGVLLGGPPLALGLALVLPKGRGMLAPLANAALLVQMIVVVVGFLLWAGLISAGVHYVVKAFAFGRTEKDPVPPKKAKARTGPKPAKANADPKRQAGAVAAAPDAGRPAPAASGGT